MSQLKKNNLLIA